MPILPNLPPMSVARTIVVFSISILAMQLSVVAQDDPFSTNRRGDRDPFGGDNPFGGPRGRGEIDREGRKLLRPDAEIYEVSKGAKDKLKLARIYAAVHKLAGNGLTRDEFVRRLKDREHFRVSLPENCKTCGGWKRVLSESSSRGPDGKIPCRSCGASGKQSKQYKVVWMKGTVTHKGDRRSKYISTLKRELGDKASSVEWLNRAKAYDGGEFSDREHSVEFAHAAYVEAMELANESWRGNESKDSNWNKLQRQVIDRCLIGIADTAPKYPQKTESPDTIPVEKPDTN